MDGSQSHDPEELLAICGHLINKNKNPAPPLLSTTSGPAVATWGW